MSSVEIPEHLIIEVTQVARYRAFEESAGGFALPDSESTDRHFFFSLPGAIALPAMIYYRTRHTGKPAFSVRINDVTVGAGVKVSVELTPIDSVTLSDGHYPGERVQPRLIGRQPGGRGDCPVPCRTGHCVPPEVW